MVSFICDACGNTVKKNQVEKHYQTQCRNCNILSCIDCGVDFPGDSYKNHTSCITEAEKYQGHLYQPKEKENKGDVKQKEWLKQVQQSSDNIKDPRLKSLLEKISEYANVPRKKKKFENFCKNSVKVYDQKTLESLWNAFNDNQSAQKNGISKEPSLEVNGIQNKSEEIVVDEEESENNSSILNVSKKQKKGKKRKREPVEEENIADNIKMNGKENELAENIQNGIVNGSKKKKKKHRNIENDVLDNDTLNTNVKEKFHWHKVIKRILKDVDGHELPIKKLRKKVLAAYQEYGTDHNVTTMDEARSMFDKKLKTYPKVKIRKEVVKLV